VRASFKSDKASVYRFAAYLDFSSAVDKWINYSNFGSTSTQSKHAIAQGGRDPQVLYMHFFKSNDSVTRMRYRLDELSSVLLPATGDPGIRVFKEEYDEDISNFLDTSLKQKPPRVWVEREAVKRQILNNPRLSTEEKLEWQHFFEELAPHEDDLDVPEDKCIKWMLPDLVERKKVYVQTQSAPQSDTEPPAILQSALRAVEPIHNDEIIIHPHFSRAEANALARAREQDYQDLLIAENEASTARTRFSQQQVQDGDDDESSITSNSGSQFDHNSSPRDEQVTRQSTIRSIKSTVATEMAFKTSLLKLNDNVMLLPTPEGQEADRNAGYHLVFNIGNILAFNMKELKVHVHWYHATRMNGPWIKWIGRDKKPYQEWIHASSLLTDHNKRIIRVNMEKVKGKGSRGKTRLDIYSQKLISRLKPSS
jgi:hypothetical protein